LHRYQGAEGLFSSSMEAPAASASIVFKASRTRRSSRSTLPAARGSRPSSRHLCKRGRASSDLPERAIQPL
jgi:hypothetical protein